MAQEVQQLSNTFAQKNDAGVGEVIIKHDGTIVSESTQKQSTQKVGNSNSLGMLSEANQ